MRTTRTHVQPRAPRIVSLSTCARDWVDCCHGPTCKSTRTRPGRHRSALPPRTTPAGLSPSAPRCAPPPVTAPTLSPGRIATSRAVLVLMLVLLSSWLPCFLEYLPRPLPAELRHAIPHQRPPERHHHYLQLPC